VPGVDDVFSALSDPTRREVLRSLSERPELTASRLAGELPITRQAVTKHLTTLESSGLLEAKRRGRERLYQFVPGRIDLARRYLDQVSAEWDDAIDRLRAHVEQE